MPTFTNENSLAVFCNHPESASIRLVMSAIRGDSCGDIHGKLTTCSAVAQIQSIVTSLPLFVLTTSHPSTQISANAVFPLSAKTHPLLRNE